MLCRMYLGHMLMALCVSKNETSSSNLSSGVHAYGSWYWWRCIVLHTTTLSLPKYWTYVLNLSFFNILPDI